MDKTKTPIVPNYHQNKMQSWIKEKEDSVRSFILENSRDDLKYILSEAISLVDAGFSADSTCEAKTIKGDAIDPRCNLAKAFSLEGALGRAIYKSHYGPKHKSNLLSVVGGLVAEQAKSDLEGTERGSWDMSSLFKKLDTRPVCKSKAKTLNLLKEVASHL